MRTSIKQVFHSAFGGNKRPRDGREHLVTFDRLALEANFHENERVRLYHEGMRRANVEWSDNFAKQCRFYSLQQLVETVLKKGVAGDFAECGCWKGHSTYIIARLLADSRFAGTFTVFDSFEGGLSERGAKDQTVRYRLTEQQMRVEQAHFASAEEQVAQVLEEFAFVRLYKGWIPERFHEAAERTFAFVHVDVDLYQPTIDSLRFFYPRLAPGGAIVVDDYGYTHFPGAKKAVDEHLAENDCSMFYEIPTGGCFLIK